MTNYERWILALNPEIQPEVPMEPMECLCGCGLFPRASLYYKTHAFRFTKQQRDEHRIKYKGYRLKLMKLRQGIAAQEAKALKELKGLKIDASDRIRKLAKGRILMSRRFGRPYDSSLPDFLAAYPPKICPCCRLEIDYRLADDRDVRDRGPSIDRVDNNKGYLVGNCAVICWGCNRKKNSSTLTDLTNAAEYYKMFISASQQPKEDLTL